MLPEVTSRSTLRAACSTHWRRAQGGVARQCLSLFGRRSPAFFFRAFIVSVLFGTGGGMCWYTVKTEKKKRVLEHMRQLSEEDQLKHLLIRTRACEPHSVLVPFVA